ncbi:MAG: hypothetical protein Kow00120_05510 [Anaerolineae bacterium]
MFHAVVGRSLYEIARPFASDAIIEAPILILRLWDGSGEVQGGVTSARCFIEALAFKNIPDDWLDAGMAQEVRLFTPANNGPNRMSMFNEARNHVPSQDTRCANHQDDHFSAFQEPVRRSRRTRRSSKSMGP